MMRPFAHPLRSDAKGSHENNPQLQREEAFRSASFAAMTLTLAAEDLGVATGHTSGSDHAAVSATFGLTANEVPVILVIDG